MIMSKALMRAGATPENHLIWTTGELIVIGLLIAAGSTALTRQRFTRPIEQAGGFPPKYSVHHKMSRETESDSTFRLEQ